VYWKLSGGCPEVVTAGKYAGEMQNVQGENENPKTGIFTCF